MRRRGFMFADALIGLLILGAGAGILVAAISGSNRAGRALDGHREALRIASETLLLMQTRSAAELPEGVTINNLDTPAASGWRWVCVSVATRNGHCELVGLVPGRQP